MANWSIPSPPRKNVVIDLTYLEARGCDIRLSRAFFSIPIQAMVFGLSILAWATVACISQPRPSEPLSARGILLNLAQRSFTELESFELRTDDGQVITFLVEGDVGLTPGHAREHMSLVEPVTVLYHPGALGPVAIHITD
ncbi:MAG: hypothetical protein ACKVVP_23390 [Chloroflexota bacterium]